MNCVGWASRLARGECALEVGLMKDENVPRSLAVRRGRGITGEIKVPGDKSISHRAAIFGALAQGTTRISNFLTAADPVSTLDCLGSLGVQWELEPDGQLVIQGAGPQGLTEPPHVLDAANSGTTMRLLLGVLAVQPFFTVLTGDSSLRSRPMDRVAVPLRRMGAVISGRLGGTRAPLAVGPAPAGGLQGGEFRLPVASAQVKSALILAGLAARGTTTVIEPHPSRDHTERLLPLFGVRVVREPGAVTVVGGGPLTAPAETLAIPADPSSAAFIAAAATVVPNSSVVIPGVGVNPTRTGFFELLEIMGGRVSFRDRRQVGEEPVADLHVEASTLVGADIGGEIIPRLIDEIPILAVLAALAQGRTEIRDAGEARVKESDRLAVMATELRRLGARVELLSDGLAIEGGNPLRGVRCDAHHDHRIAMALAVAGLAAEGETVIEGMESVGISFPAFAAILTDYMR